MAHSAAVLARFRAPRYAQAGPDGEQVGRAGARVAGGVIEIHLHCAAGCWRARFRAYGDPAAIAAADWVAEALDGAPRGSAKAPPAHAVVRALELPVGRRHCADLATQAAAAALGAPRAGGRSPSTGGD